VDKVPIPGQEIVQYIASVAAGVLAPALVVAINPNDGTAILELLADGSQRAGVPYSRDRLAVGHWCYKGGF
jgi:hypothetical protein